MHSARTLVTCTAFAALALTAVACGDDDATTDAGQDTPTTQTTEAPADATTIGDVEITGAWARTSPMMASRGAVYADLTSEDGDELVSASVGTDVAATVELHETTMPGQAMPGQAMPGGMTDTTMMSETTMPGAMDDEAPAAEMGMRAVEGIDLPAGETVSLKPGGYHIMLIDLVAPLEEGTTIDVELTFASGATGTVTVPVRAAAP